LIARTFDYILVDAINRADGRGIPFGPYAEISGAFVAFMEEQAREYIEAVEPAYILGTQCNSVDEFLNTVSVQRLYCYRALSPVHADIDPFLADADSEFAEPFWDLVRELRAPPKALMEVLWRGRWRHARFWGREFYALRLEMSNARKRNQRSEAKERKLTGYLDGAFHQMQDVESQKDSMISMESALFRAWLLLQEAKPRVLNEGALEEAGRLVGLKSRERKLLVKRARGEVRRNPANNASWEAVRSKFPQLAAVLPPMLEEG
jgi:hypothetical protein